LQKAGDEIAAAQQRGEEGAQPEAEREGEGALVVTLFPDSGERYLSKLNETWLREKGLA